MFSGPPPDWSLVRPKPFWQTAYDVVGAPLRMAALPDHTSERLHLTSLRAERLAVALGELRGRVLDIGAGDNMLLSLYRDRQRLLQSGLDAQQSIGVDVVDWGGGCVVLDNCRELPFPDCSFDTVSMIACLNHIPERLDTLHESYRVLRPGGRLVVTMIGRITGGVGHAIWWYSEDKIRDVQPGEVMGMNPGEVKDLIVKAGFASIQHQRFLYGLNHMFVANRA